MASAGGRVSLALGGGDHGLEQARRRLDKWARGRMAGADGLRQAHEAALAAGAEELAALGEKEAAALEKGGALQARLAEEQAMEKALKEQAREAAAAADAVPAELAQVKAQLEAKKGAVREAEEELEALGAARHQRLDALKQATRLYRDRLGLAFHNSEASDLEELNIVFTQIDPNNPDRPFLFGLHVEEGDVFVLTKCVPEVAGTAAPLEQLNKDNNLCLFVRSMRQKFKKLVAEGA